MQKKREQLDMMEVAALAAHPAPHALANECGSDDVAVPDGSAVGFDAVDNLGVANLPGEVELAARPSMNRLATDLARMGAIGGAARRLAARDVSIARVRLRLLEGLQALALSQWSDDPRSMKKALALQRMIEGEHRRLLASMELLRRTERAPAAVDIKVNRMAIVVNR